jgi:hypothetical protein
MRARQKNWEKMEPMDADAYASEDLGILWRQVFARDCILWPLNRLVCGRIQTAD